MYVYSEFAEYNSLYYNKILIINKYVITHENNCRISTKLS